MEAACLICEVLAQGVLQETPGLGMDD
jgi:hypothetical protein